MNQRICIGIQSLLPGWKPALDQAGVHYEEVSYGRPLLKRYSVIILNEKVHQKHLGELKEFVSSGGSLLEMVKSPVFFDSTNISSKRVSTLINASENPAYQHIPFLDICGKASFHEFSDTFNGFIHTQNFDNGNLGFFGANLPNLLSHKKYSRKRFFNPSGKYPSEIVNKVSKHEILQLFIALLKELHFLRGLPFVSKWESPGKKPVFCFRVDSDFGDQKAMDAIYEIADEKKSALTWFLHVEAHEKWLDHFHSYKNQEIALHGYSHGTSISAAKTSANLDKGNKLLKENGFEAKGFCAPYGIWNNALVQTLAKKDFSYTSEFTFTYDGFPIQPKESHLPLQIPMHPICTGSLKREELSVSEMTTYFEFILINKLARFEPVIFYHHPLQDGLEAIEHMIKRVSAEKLVNLTFAQFADFWRKRRDFRFQAFWDGTALEIISPTDNEIFFQVSNNHQSFGLISSGVQKMEKQNFSGLEYAKQYLPEPNQVNEMRDRDIKLIKTSILDWKNRIRL
ncbi:MAG: DUF2334 domain-containing protein [Balneolaceae bacterium]